MTGAKHGAFRPLNQNSPSKQGLFAQFATVHPNFCQIFADLLKYLLSLANHNQNLSAE
jgi:hypothetical protein